MGDSKIYKYNKEDNTNMIPSDPYGSLDESLFRILIDSYWRLYYGKHLGIS